MSAAARNIGPTRLLKFWISPIGCALISYALFLLAWAMPSDLYESIVREPDLMHFSFLLWLFVTGCVTTFLSGVLVKRKLGGPVAYTPRIPPMNNAFPTLIMVILAASAALNLYSLAQIIHQSGNLLGQIKSGGGAAIKATINTEGALTEALPLSYGLVWWAVVRHDQLRNGDVAGWGAVNIFIIASIAIAAAAATLRVARFELIPFILGLFIVSMRHRIFRTAIRPRHVFLAIIGAPALIIAIFFVFAAIRGIGDIDRQMASLMGYGPASFNRLQALLAGHLVYAYGGHGLYTIGFLGRVPLLHGIIPLDRMLGIPPWEQAFLSEFVTVRQSGLEGQFIWPTAFGYIYADLGWWTFAYMFVLGAMIEASWAAWNRGGTFGTLMYPFLAGTVLLWGSSNLIIMPRFVTLAGAGAVLTFIEGMLRPRAAKRFIAHRLPAARAGI